MRIVEDGQALDEQEGQMPKVLANAEETLGLLRRFDEKTDAGRAGEHATPL